MAHLTISLLGPPEVKLDGSPVTALVTSRARALLAYLVVEPDRAHRRPSLAGLLWPDWPERSARTNLRNTLSSLRKAIGDQDADAGPPFLIVTRETIQFNRASDCWIDVDTFGQLVDAAHGVDAAASHQLEKAIALYRGPFLEGFSIDDSPTFEDWALSVRDLLAQKHLAALQRLGECYEHSGNYERASEVLRRWVTLAPWHEQAHQALMRLLALNGQRGAALAQYEACRRALREELDVEPGKETTRLYERIRDGELMPGQEARAQDVSPAPPPPPAKPLPSSQQIPSPASPIPSPPPPFEPITASAGPVPLTGERRLATVLMADVKGSTALAEQVDVEEWVEMMNEVLQILSAEIYRYGGEVDQYRGDGLVAFFGVPAAHEDDPERAVLAALAMQEAIGRYAADLAQRAGIELLLRIGLNTGEVIAAHVGDDRQHGEDTAMGRAIALADRMEKAAEPGTVLVSENTYRLTEQLFRWQSLAEITVKGFSQPVAVYRPLSARPGSSKGRGIAGLESPLVGREREFQALQESILSLQSGVGGIVSVVGEAGIGKSRLVAEVKQSALAAPSGISDPRPSANLRWVDGRCLSYGASTAYQLWLDILRGRLGVAPDAGPQVLREALRGLVTALCPDCMDDVYPYLGHVLSVPLEDEVAARLSLLESENLKVHTFRAVAILAESSARRRPLVIACDDLHWADPTSIELLIQLLPLTDRVPLLFICVFRPETEHACWQVREMAERDYRHRHTGLWLDPLSAGEGSDLVAHLLPVPSEGQAFKERILSHAEGNPFYVEETIRSLIDQGILVHDEDSGQWRATREAADIPIPDTLHAVLAARIDRLPREARRVLQLASVIGRVFAHRVLVAIAGDAPALETHLVALQRAQMIRERARLPEREFIFKHHLTQETAYGILLARERRAYHGQVAETLERLYSGRLEEYVELLAHHWEQAGEADRAVEYFVRAGRKAARQYANQEALDYLGQALAYMAPGNEYDRVLEGRAKVLLDLFRGQEAAHDYEQLLESARRHGDRKAEAESLIGLASAHYILALDAQVPDAASRSRELYNLARRLAQELGDKRLVVRAITPTTWFIDFWPEHRHEITADVREALRLSREIGDQDLIIDSTLALARTGSLELPAQEEEIIAQLESRRDVARLNQLYFLLMWFHLLRGTLEKCVECCESGAQLAAEIGLPPVQYPTLKALALMRLGRYGAAWASLQEEVADEAHPFGRAFRDLGMGIYLTDLLAYEKAVPVLRDVVEQNKPLGRTWLQAWAYRQIARTIAPSAPQRRDELEAIAQDLISIDHTVTSTLRGEPERTLAETSLALGQLDRALEQVERACARTEENGARPDHASALEIRARILLELGRAQEALSAADAGLEMAEEMGYLPMVWRLQAARARALEALGNDGEAAQAYASATAVIRKLADTIPDREIVTGFLSNPSVASILAASRDRSGRWEKGT